VHEGASPLSLTPSSGGLTWITTLPSARLSREFLHRLFGILAAILVFFVWLYWRIFEKAGYSVRSRSSSLSGIGTWRAC